MTRTNNWLGIIIAGFLAACATAPEPDPAVTAGTEFSDCPACPVMISVPAGSYLMGTAEGAGLIDPRTGKPVTNDRPQHEVTIARSFAIGKYEVTAGEYGEFVAATGYRNPEGCMEFSPADSFVITTERDWNNTGFAQTSRHPVTCVSWFDAQAYVAWLSAATGKNYRLPTEAEWEYAARAGTTTPYFWGTSEQQSCEFANIRSQGADSISTRQTESDSEDGFPCDDGAPHTSAAGIYRPNEFGLHDMQGNAWEWAEDCIHKDYKGAPTDGSAWTEERCNFGVIRGGSYINRVERSSVTVRAGRPRAGKATNMGMRVVRDFDATTGAAAAAAVEQQVAAEISNDSAGARLFADNCAACHQRTDTMSGIYGTDVESLTNLISSGGNNIMSMPAFGDMLSETEIRTIAAYLREMNGW